jgi:hypothetical protein
MIDLDHVLCRSSSFVIRVCLHVAVIRIRLSSRIVPTVPTISLVACNVREGDNIPGTWSRADALPSARTDSHTT